MVQIENQYTTLLELLVSEMNMRLFSYKLDHDYGLAPNPHGGYCTLAVCKSSIRRNKNIEIGDWIIGTGSVALGRLHHLIYAMKLEEKLTFQEYWEDPRFEYKKPRLNGSLVQLYGDNIYHLDLSTKKWIQENAAHSLKSGEPNTDHLERDVSGEYVLISKEYYYFGDASIQIPEAYREVCNEGRDMKWKKIPGEVRDEFILWLTKSSTVGILGDPISWNEY